MIHVFRTALLFACLVGLAAAQTSSRPASQPLAADRIVAVVNDEELPHLYIVKSGLEATDRILLEGLRKVRNGQEIAVNFQSPEVMMSELALNAE